MDEVPITLRTISPFPLSANKLVENSLNSLMQATIKKVENKEKLNYRRKNNHM